MQTNVIKEVLEQALTILRGAWRFRWQALIVAWLIAMAGWLYVLLLPNEFEASTRIYVDTESTLRPLMKGFAVPTDVMTQVNMMTVALLGRPQLEKVARETDLDLQATNEREKEALIDDLTERIRIGADTQRGLYRISYRDRDRDTALNVVQALLDIFKEDILYEQRTDTSDAVRFLERQKLDYEKRLRDAEQELADFKKKNVGLMPSDRGDYYARLEEATQQITTTETQLRTAVTRRNELQRQLVGEEPVFGMMPGSGTSGASAHDATIAQLEAELAGKLLRFTEKHPDVINLRETIAQLEQKKQEELQLQASTQGAQQPGLAQNPVYQSMRISLSETQVEVASLQSRLAEQRRRADELRELVDTVPEVEAQLAQLTRDYQVTKTAYEDILRRLEQARVSREVDAAQDVDFREIEPVDAPLVPVAPNRPILMSLMLAGGLAAGIGLALFLSQVNPVLTDRRRLRALSGLPVLGAVRLVTTPQQRNKQRLAYGSFALGCLSLAVLYMGMLTYASSGARFVQQILARVI